MIPLAELPSRRDFCRALSTGGLAFATLGCSTSAIAVAPRSRPADLAPLLKDLGGSSFEVTNDRRDALLPPRDQSVPPADIAGRDLAKGPYACPDFLIRTFQPPDAFVKDTATFYADGPLFVCRDAGGLFSVTGICTHNGGTLGAVAGGAGGFHCSSHGSNFALDGHVTGGPAFFPLEHFALCLDGDGHLGVDVVRNVDPAYRYLFA